MVGKGVRLIVQIVVGLNLGVSIAVVDIYNLIHNLASLLGERRARILAWHHKRFTWVGRINAIPRKLNPRVSIGDNSGESAPADSPKKAYIWVNIKGFLIHLAHATNYCLNVRAKCTTADSA